MCGRFTLQTPPGDLVRIFDAGDAPELTARYNIAPTQTIPIVRTPGSDRRREIALVHWGLIPSWAKDPAIGNRLINARSETAGDKPSFRSAFKHRRCLVPADGFYEWQKSGKLKRPFHIRMKDPGPFAIAGLWESWRDPAGNSVESCTLLTTGPNELVGKIHDRMPVILDPKDYEFWLDSALKDGEKLTPLFVPYPADRMCASPVSTRVNNPKFDDPGCLTPEEG